MEIKVKRNITLSYIEELYQLIADSVNPVIIHLPKDTDRINFGVIPSFIQFFATQIRRKRFTKIVLPYSEIDELKRYIEVEFVYPCIVLAWDIFITDENNYNLKTHLSSISQQYFSKLEFLQVKALRSLPLYNFDHDITQRGLSRFFYNSDFNLASLGQLEFNLHPIFHKITSAHNTQESKRNLSPILLDLTEIIFELFKNTHEHGKSDLNGGYLFPNIRNVTLKTIRKKRSSYLADSSLSKSAKEYFKKQIPLTEQGDFIMLEISVLDSGIGMVKKISNIEDLTTISIEKEVQWAKECLLKHRTSSSSYAATIKGQGLDKVMQLLDGKGFLRIRSGRLDLFRNFISDPYMESTDIAEVVLKDFVSNDLEWQEHPEVSGTLHTFYYPLSIE